MYVSKTAKSTLPLLKTTMESLEFYFSVLEVFFRFQTWKNNWKYAEYFIVEIKKKFIDDFFLKVDHNLRKAYLFIFLTRSLR